MKNQVILDYWDKRHMQEILSDSTLLSAILMDGEVARSITINMDGSIVIGRTPWTFVNWLFRDQRTISFTDFAFKVANALSGQVNNRNEVIFDGITEVITNMHREGHRNERDIRYVVDGLFDTFRHGWEGGRKSTFTKMSTSSGKTKQRVTLKEDSIIPITARSGEIRLNSGELLTEVTIIERANRK